MNESVNFLKMMQDSSMLFGGNNVFIEGLYEDFLGDPASVPREWREYFERMIAGGKLPDTRHSLVQRSFAAIPATRQGGATPQSAMQGDEARKQASVLQLINAHRFLGVRVADLDPLARHTKPQIAELNPAYYNLGEADMNTTFNTGSLVGGARMTLREILQRLRRIYCGSVGAEYMYISDIAQKRWIQNRLEGERGELRYPAEMKLSI